MDLFLAMGVVSEVILRMFIVEQFLASCLLPAAVWKPNHCLFIDFHLFVFEARRITERFLQENKYVLANGCLRAHSTHRKGYPSFLIEYSVLGCMLYLILRTRCQELRKDGFDLAETRFKELKPILDEVFFSSCYSLLLEGNFQYYLWSIFYMKLYVNSFRAHSQLAVLEAEQKTEEEASASTSSKKDPKKGKQKSAGR